jgi:hypothetical protein
MEFETRLGINSGEEILSDCIFCFLHLVLVFVERTIEMKPTQQLISGKISA